jgi:predicted aconitase with swiveling domain
MTGRVVAPGRARGVALVTDQPIGFYGGVDPATGVVIEEGHPLAGQCVSGRVLCFPCGKGSTVGSYVIYGLARHGVAPCAIVNRATETIVATGAILAGVPCVDGIDLAALRTGDLVEVDADEAARVGTVRHV